MNWIELIKNPEIRRILAENEGSDTAKLALKWAGKKDIPVNFLLTQIAGRKIAAKKLPDLYKIDSIIYPDKTALEQCSSTLAAQNKQRFIPKGRVADLTGGLGIDSISFAKASNSVVYIEPNEDRLKIAIHNFKELGLQNVDFQNSTAEEFLKNLKTKEFDLIYLDPSRRDENNRRAFRLSDLQPDVLQLKSQILFASPKLLLKVGPMLDITEAIRELGKVTIVNIVSIKDECKELLFYVDEKASENPEIICSELKDDGNSEFKFDYQFEKILEIKIGKFSNYIYDPQASIIKAGGFKSIADKYELIKLNANTHLYTSEQLINNFPGKCYEVISQLDFDLKTLKSELKNKNFHLVFRNFPEDATKVSNKLNLKSGGDRYLFFYTDFDQKPQVIEVKRLY
jgi:16S rRNA G966 N2-methylase RsmD